MTKVVLVLGVVALFACNTDPGKGKTKAQVGAAASAAAPAAGATPYAFSGAGSTLEFVGAKVTRKHEGSFKSFKGSVQLVDGKIEKSSVDVEISMASITIDEPKLQHHLQTPDFFDVEKFPKARFKSTSIKPGGEGGATHTVTGNLELHGVTKSITFPATIKLAGDKVDVRAQFAIDRKDFGIVYPGMPDDLIKDEVLIKLDIHAKKA